MPSGRLLSLPAYRCSHIILDFSENAEARVFQRLDYFQSIRNKNRSQMKVKGYPIVGVLGCMAERLKDKLFEKKSVDFVCGPDAYRDIPQLLDKILTTDQKHANVQLSLDETYADITPIREIDSSSGAFVSIMRGCNNMCSYCIGTYLELFSLNLTSF